MMTKNALTGKAIKNMSSLTTLSLDGNGIGISNPHPFLSLLLLSLSLILCILSLLYSLSLRFSISHNLHPSSWCIQLFLCQSVCLSLPLSSFRSLSFSISHTPTCVWQAQRVAGSCATPPVFLPEPSPLCARIMFLATISVPILYSTILYSVVPVSHKQ